MRARPRCSVLLPGVGSGNDAMSVRHELLLEGATPGENLLLLAGVGTGAGPGSDGSIAAISCSVYMRPSSGMFPAASCKESTAWYGAPHLLLLQSMRNLLGRSVGVHSE